MIVAECNYCQGTAHWKDQSIFSPILSIFGNIYQKIDITKPEILYSNDFMDLWLYL